MIVKELGMNIRLFSLVLTVLLSMSANQSYASDASQSVINALRHDSHGKLQAERKSNEVLAAEMQALVMARENKRLLALVNISTRIEQSPSDQKKELRAIAELVLENSKDQKLNQVATDAVQALKKGNCCCGVSQKTVLAHKKLLQASFHPYFEEQTRLAVSAQNSAPVATAIGFEEVSFK
jgi:hypothetical protein